MFRRFLVVAIAFIGCIVVKDALVCADTSNPSPAPVVTAVTVPSSTDIPPLPPIGDTSPPTDTSSDSDAVPNSSPQMVKQSEHFSRELNYCTISGEVKNITDKPMADVEAFTTFYDASGGVIKTAYAMITYNPVMPGQISAYETLTPDNPLIKTEKTEFKFFSGEPINFTTK